MTSAIDVRDLRVRYRDVVALSDTTLAVEKGRVCALIGVNGSGKSSLFGALMGTVPFDRGTVSLLGRAPNEVRRTGELAYVPQLENVDRSYPIAVRDVVLMGRYRATKFARRTTKQDSAIAEAALETVGLTDFSERRIGALSGGQRKRVFLARAIAQQADLLLLDEPFTGVDAVSQELMTTLLRELVAEGKTVLISTHDINGVPGLADEAALVRGSIVFHGSVDDALEPMRLASAFGLTREDER